MKEARKPKPTILAPAGSVEQLVAAVNNGCDAVYLGLDSFNARMKAANFTLENLSEHIDYCHLFGVKVFVALNISVKNSEFDRAAELLLQVYERNADGVIVTDLALMRLAAALPKPFDVVASTQLNAHDKLGAEFLKELGATTVVCARECSLEDIRGIASTGIDVECFLHGALCVCQSGQCLFSSMVGGNSGNRGLCAQPCRKKYSAENGRSGYLLSARDIIGLDTAKDLMEAGATTFKIEGRNRRAEYAGITSRIYRKVFDDNFVYSDCDAVQLAEMYNRAMRRNNYLYKRNDDIIYDKCQNHTGVYVGNLNGKYLETQIDITNGDGFKIIDDNGAEVCGAFALENGKGKIRLELDGRARSGMRVFRTTSVSLCRDIVATRKKLPITMSFDAHIGCPARLTVNYNDVTISEESDFLAQKALNAPTTSEEISKQLQKIGETHYTIKDIVSNIDEIFLAKSQINDLRRRALDKLTRTIIERYNRRFSDRRGAVLYQKKVERIEGERSVSVICKNEEELRLAREHAKYLIYKPNKITAQEIEQAIKYDAFIDIPPFTKSDFLINVIRKLPAKLVCHNISHVETARLLGLKYIAGSGLNIFNDYILQEFDDAESFVYSQELTANEIADFMNQSGIIFVDGEITLMKLVHCPYKAVYGGDCSGCKADKPLQYRDELGNTFKLNRRIAGSCNFELINGNKLSAVSKLKRAGHYLIDYDKDILFHYIALNNGVVDGYIERKPYTKGRLFDKIN